ncbi:hypothetical protein CDV31_004023 [Fusarium ambrosium]|uniref:Uncharacterized protein n=1 Tax=Fusarium ambrosium TaxID=131363 RepID=A0A428US89_9HYPO|nr:hypothetical protein CDV31_004023 [Fusarium ambrosium]
MRLGGCEQCQLFLAVYPAFVEALPIISTSSNIQSTDIPVSTYTLSLDNLITELRDEVKKIGIIFNEEDARCELRDELFQDARNALDQILFFFEDLVHDGITDKRHTIYGYENDAAAIVADIPQTRKTEARNIERICPNDIRHDIIWNRAEIVLSCNIDGAAVQSAYEEDIFQSSLAQAKRLSEASRLLFSFLEQKVCHEKEGNHEGHLRLSGFDQAELDMMLSICGHAGKWQQAYFRLADEKMEKKIVDCLCPLLKQSLRLRQPTQMMFDERGIYKFVIRKDRPKSRRAPSKETLGDILRGEERGRQKTPSHRTLKHNKKRGLGVEIATALLHLFGSPLLQARVLDANSIYILRDEDATPEAYVSFSLSSDPAERTVSDVEAEDGDPSLLALAVILLELELEREITPCNEDIDELSGQPSLYVAATRHHGELEDNVDANFFGIIEECLQLYADSVDMDGTSYNSKIQAELLSKVVIPLTERYEMLRNTRQPAIRPPPDYGHGLSTGVEPATWQTGRLRGSDQRMDTIAEGKEQPQLEACPTAAPYTSLAISEPRFLAGTISGSWTWLQRVDRTNDLMDWVREKHLKEKTETTEKRVRIAILDTGCSMDADCIVTLANGEARLQGHWCDWAGKSTHPIDEDAQQHGTSTAALLLRVARHAEVFVGRVAKDQKHLNGATNNIVDAISHAATVWDVDIVTMSFGFNTRITAIEKMIGDVIGKRRNEGRDILFFAAANNDGLNSREMFPASDLNVISVRGTNHTGKPLQEYNPSPWPQKVGHSCFGTLGKDVPYDCADRCSQKSGCSVATPILAGIMATIIQYVGYVAASNDLLQNRVRTRDGIQQVMGHMADSVPGNPRYKYVAPWKFFQRTEEERIALIVNALAEMQRIVK